MTEPRVDRALIERTEPVAGEWIEVGGGHDLIRYRFDDAEHAHYTAEYELEYWHEQRQEWRPVVNWSSRDWFVIGLIAGRDAARAALEGET